MATTPTFSPNTTLFTFALLLLITSTIQANDLTSGLKLEEWPMSMAKYIGLEKYEELENGLFEDDGENGLFEDDGENGESEMSGRRSLFWRGMHYYISYGALSANRIPCPPRSGRSYYTHNCFKARTPVNPYYRGCSRITRCRR